MKRSQNQGNQVNVPVSLLLMVVVTQKMIINLSMGAALRLKKNCAKISAAVMNELVFLSNYQHHHDTVSLEAVNQNHDITTKRLCYTAPSLLNFTRGFITQLLPVILWHSRLLHLASTNGSFLVAILTQKQKWNFFLSSFLAFSSKTCTTCKYLNISVCPRHSLFLNYLQYYIMVVRIF